MSLPHLLLVDDSEAILAFERAALSSHSSVSTATTGAEALEKVRQVHPAAMLLDLSMPEIDGGEVLRQLQEDPELRSIPVIVVSSEKHRKEECLRGGAAAFLAKPIRAAELAELVGQVLARFLERKREGSMRVLFVSVGGQAFGLPLEAVDSAVQLPLTRRLPAGPSYLSEFVEVYGEPLCVLDLAIRLGVEPAVPRLEQKLVVVRNEQQKLALKVDRVEDPEELPREAVVPRERLGGAGDGPLRDLLVAMVQGSRGALPVLDPRALIQRALWRQLPALAALGSMAP